MYSPSLYWVCTHGCTVEAQLRPYVESGRVRAVSVNGTVATYEIDAKARIRFHLSETNNGFRVCLEVPGPALDLSGLFRESEMPADFFDSCRRAGYGNHSMRLRGGPSAGVGPVTHFMHLRNGPSTRIGTVALSAEGQWTVWFTVRSRLEAERLSEQLDVILDAVSRFPV